MFRSAKVVENGLVTDYLALAAYAESFAAGEDGVPRLSSESSPLSSLPGYPLAYESLGGSGRIVVKGLLPGRND